MVYYIVYGRYWHKVVISDYLVLTGYIYSPLKLIAADHCEISSTFLWFQNVPKLNVIPHGTVKIKAETLRLPSEYQ